uniref:Uncharacterized protein n=1 Tax=Triticum urartu TaxID=4572 RepID=A0A8R7UHK9_TRIUA
MLASGDGSTTPSISSSHHSITIPTTLLISHLEVVLRRRCPHPAAGGGTFCSCPSAR